MTKKPTNFKLILIRHGQSEANLRSDLISGRSPGTVLSKKGELQAANLGKWLKQNNQKLDIIYSSPLVRSRQTAHICLDNCKPELIDKIKFDDRLSEFNRGKWEGRSKSEIYTLETQNLINKQKTWFCHPGGESLRMLKNRATDFLETEIMEKFYSDELNDQTVIVFGHCMWIRVILMEILGLNPIITMNLQIDNASITKLEFGDFGWKLNYLNRVAEGN